MRSVWDTLGYCLLNSSSCMSGGAYDEVNNSSDYAFTV